MSQSPNRYPLHISAIKIEGEPELSEHALVKLLMEQLPPTEVIGKRWFSYNKWTGCWDENDKDAYRSLALKVICFGDYCRWKPSLLKFLIQANEWLTSIGCTSFSSGHLRYHPSSPYKRFMIRASFKLRLQVRGQLTDYSRFTSKILHTSY